MQTLLTGFIPNFYTYWDKNNTEIMLRQYCSDHTAYEQTVPLKAAQPSENTKSFCAKGELQTQLTTKTVALIATCDGQVDLDYHTTSDEVKDTTTSLTSFGSGGDISYRRKIMIPLKDVVTGYTDDNYGLIMGKQTLVVTFTSKVEALLDTVEVNIFTQTNL